ncbi:MAG: ThuA domain-containing protein [Phycisphaerae bacterium]
MAGIKVLVWNEGRQKNSDAAIERIYPRGIHGAIVDALSRDVAIRVESATLEDPEHGLPPSRLDQTDVLIWWGHQAHDMVRDEVVDRVYKRVLGGMGLIVLHSGHFSKIFKRLMGTSCDLKWREAHDREVLWVTTPGHPIVHGITDHFVLEQEEMYGEHFDIPEPDETVLISWFSGGEVFRSGVTYRRGMGRIFYFRPGHETFPTYHHADVQKIITNAVHWAAPVNKSPSKYGHCPEVIP